MQSSTEIICLEALHSAAMAPSGWLSGPMAWQQVEESLPNPRPFPMAWRCSSPYGVNLYMPFSAIPLRPGLSFVLHCTYYLTTMPSKFYCTFHSWRAWNLASLKGCQCLETSWMSHQLNIVCRHTHICVFHRYIGYQLRASSPIHVPDHYILPACCWREWSTPSDKGDSLPNYSHWQNLDQGYRIKGFVSAANWLGY